VILAIVLPLTLKKSDDNNNPPSPPSPVPDNYNPYNLDKSNIKNDNQISFGGIL